MEVTAPIEEQRTGRILIALRGQPFPSGRTRALIASKSKPNSVGKIRVGLYPDIGANELEFVWYPADTVFTTRDPH